MARVATAKNLAVSQNRATKDSSRARLGVYDRRLECGTRAFTLLVVGARVVSRAKHAGEFLAVARPGPTYAAPSNTLGHLTVCTLQVPAVAASGAPT